MKDIAIAAGVSRSAVSHTLNERYKGVFITDASRKLIKETAKQLGYIPNDIARSIKNGNTRMIAYLDQDMGRHDYTGKIMSGIMQRAAESGYHIKLFSPEINGTETTVNDLLRQRVSGVICRGVSNATLDILHENLCQYNTPYVLLHSGKGRKQGVFVATNDEDGCFQAALHLKEKGHKTIALIAGNIDPALPRISGFINAVNKLELQCTPELQKACNQSNISETIKQLRHLPESLRPTAVFCPTDTHAMYLLQALYDLDLKVPRDIAVVGYGGLHEGRLAAPRLTTVVQPFEQSGRKACELLLEQLDQEQPDCFSSRRLELLPIELSVEKST